MASTGGDKANIKIGVGFGPAFINMDAVNWAKKRTAALIGDQDAVRWAEEYAKHTRQYAGELTRDIDIEILTRIREEIAHWKKTGKTLVVLVNRLSKILNDRPRARSIAEAELLADYTKELAEQIDAETLRRILTEVAHSIESGEAQKRLVKRLEALLNNRLLADLIAMTEDTKAFAEGNLLAWKKTNEDFGAEIIKGRMWFTAEDSFVCPICKSLNTRRAKLDKPFVVNIFGNETMVQNPPAHPGCRCSIRPVVA